MTTYKMTCGFETRHEVRDERKVASIAASLERDGWIGAPVVIYDAGTLVAVTGVHRLEACERAGRRPHTITLREVFDEAGLDLAEIEVECDYDLRAIIDYLPEETAAKYGIEQ